MRSRRRFRKTEGRLERLEKVVNAHAVSLDQEIVLLIAQGLVARGKGKDDLYYYDVLDVILAEVARLDEENPTGADEETDRRIDKLLDLGTMISKEMDAIVRANPPKNPKLLAEWNEVTKGLYNDDKTDTNKSKT